MVEQMQQEGVVRRKKNRIVRKKATAVINKDSPHRSAKVSVYQIESGTFSVKISTIIDYLGGAQEFPVEIRTPLDTHHIIEQGFSGRTMNRFVDSFTEIRDRKILTNVMGMSTRTWQRIKPDTTMTPEVSGRLWQFAQVLAEATNVFGSREEAEKWLATPAVALGEEKPIELLSTPVGMEMVRTLLKRIDYGVYA